MTCIEKFVIITLSKHTFKKKNRKIKIPKDNTVINLRLNGHRLISAILLLISKINYLMYTRHARFFTQEIHSPGFLAQKSVLMQALIHYETEGDVNLYVVVLVQLYV